jgi:hypothetical protein
MPPRELEDASGMPRLGRREFFGLCAWRIAQIGAGVVLVSEMGRRAAVARPGANPCTPASPNQCTTPTPNICGTACGVNTCNGGVSSGNICSPPGSNSCRGTAGGPWNACQGGSAGGAANVCNGANANYCTSTAGANTCVHVGNGVANCCGTPGANSCDPGANDPFCAWSVSRVLVDFNGPPHVLAVRRRAAGAYGLLSGALVTIRRVLGGHGGRGK